MKAEMWDVWVSVLRLSPLQFTQLLLEAENDRLTDRVEEKRRNGETDRQRRGTERHSNKERETERGSLSYINRLRLSYMYLLGAWEKLY